MSPWVKFIKAIARPRFIVPIIMVVATWGITDRVVSSSYENDILNMKNEAAQVLLKETNRVLELERLLSQSNNRLEDELNKRKKERQDANNRYDSLVNDGFRLRDKYERELSRCHQDSETTESGDGKTGGELSKELTGFLIREANRADGVVDQLTACQDYVESLLIKINNPK